MFKYIEGIRIRYDHTARGSDSSFYQLFHGGDMLDVTRSRHSYLFGFNAMNYVSLINLYRSERIVEIVNEEDAMRYNRKTFEVGSVRLWLYIILVAT